MAEIVSEDVMEWARDLAALQKLLAGQQLPVSPSISRPSCFSVLSSNRK